jgi:hypothetical protein
MPYVMHRPYFGRYATIDHFRQPYKDGLVGCGLGAELSNMRLKCRPPHSRCDAAICLAMERQIGKYGWITMSSSDYERAKRRLCALPLSRSSLGAGEADKKYCGGKYTTAEIQQKLTTLGYYKGPIDGKGSVDLLNATMAFCQAKGCEISLTDDTAFCAALEKASPSAGGDVAGAGWWANQSTTRKAVVVVGASMLLWLVYMATAEALSSHKRSKR